MSRSRRSKRSGGSQKKQKITARNYWGSAKATMPDARQVEPSGDPAAVVRSLGAPPLSGQDQAAELAFEIVYERAVNLAVALAAAGDLLAVDDAADADGA